MKKSESSKTEKIYSYGYKKLDELTGGIHPGELILVAGRPGMGKTTFLKNIYSNICN